MELTFPVAMARFTGFMGFAVFRESVGLVKSGGFAKSVGLVQVG